MGNQSGAMFIETVTRLSIDWPVGLIWPNRSGQSGVFRQNAYICPSAGVVVVVVVVVRHNVRQSYISRTD